MTDLANEIICKLQGKTLVTAESCTGGAIGGILTAVPGSSAVFKGGVISYCDEVKAQLLGVSENTLQQYGAVSAPVAIQMADGVRKLLHADIAISVTGLAGPGGDAFGNPVGTVFVGYADSDSSVSYEYHFSGDRDSVRKQTVHAALILILERNRGDFS